MVKAIKATGTSATFMHDLATAFLSGTVFSSTDEIREKHKASLPTKFLPDKKGLYKLAGGGTTPHLHEKIDNWVNNHVERTQNTLQMINTLAQRFPLPPDKSPLTHSAHLIKILFDHSGGCDCPEMLQDVEDLDLPRIKNDLETIESMEEDAEEIPFYDMSAMDFEIRRMQQWLKKRSALNYTATGPLRRDVEGKIVHQGLVSGFEDFPKVSQQARLSPTLTLDLLTQKVTKPTRYTQEHLTPWITLIIDDSGSMSNTKKRGKALGVLYHFLKMVKAGQMGLTFGWFETTVKGITNFSPGDDALDWFKSTACRHGFNGGGTEVGECIEYMLDYFEQELPSHLPEDLVIDVKFKDIVVVNDGQDDVSNVTLSLLNGAKLRAFVLEEENDELKEIAVASGGTYKEFH